MLARKVEVRQTPKEKWEDPLEKIGFTKDAIKNFIEMTEVVISGKAKPELEGKISIKMKTTLSQYLRDHTRH